MSNARRVVADSGENPIKRPVTEGSPSGTPARNCRYIMENTKMNRIANNAMVIYLFN